MVADDAKLTGAAGSHNLQLRWYVKGNTKEQEDNRWDYTRGHHSGILSIEMFPNMPAEYSKINRSYGYYESIDDAIGVEMNVDFRTSLVRLVSSLTSVLESESSPKVVRIDYEPGTAVESQLAETTWTWLLPTASAKEGQIGDSFVVGRAGCLRAKATDIQGYCLFSGRTLQHEGETLVKAEKDLSIDVDLIEGKVSVDSPIATSLALYWPQSVSTIVDAAGMPVAFTVVSGTLMLDVEKGQSIFSVK